MVSHLSPMTSVPGVDEADGRLGMARAYNLLRGHHSSSSPGPAKEN